MGLGLLSMGLSSTDVTLATGFLSLDFLPLDHFVNFCCDFCNSGSMLVLHTLSFLFLFPSSYSDA